MLVFANHGDKAVYYDEKKEWEESFVGWMYVVFASIIEVFWVLGLRFSETFLHWTGTVIAITLSFYFIIKACEQIPSGTVYAVFTGAGAAMIVLLDFTLFDADFSWGKLALIGLIIIGVIGIKITTDEQQSDQSSRSSTIGGA